MCVLYVLCYKSAFNSGAALRGDLSKKYHKIQPLLTCTLDSLCYIFALHRIGRMAGLKAKAKRNQISFSLIGNNIS